jgi:type IV pilus assembly protein PilM
MVAEVSTDADEGAHGRPYRRKGCVGTLPGTGDLLMVAMPSLRRRRSVGLDIGRGAIKAVTVERRGHQVRVTGIGVTPVAADAETHELGRAITSALAAARSEGEPVATSIGGPEVIMRHVSLPTLPPSKIIQVLEFQHEELGLLPPAEGVVSAQVLRRSRDGASTEVLAVSVPRKLVEARTRLLQQAVVPVSVLDVEPLALLNGALHLSGLHAGELLVAVTIDSQSTAVCLFSEQGPVMARYLEVGAEHLTERPGPVPANATESRPGVTPAVAAVDVPRAGEADGAVIDRIATEIRLSLAAYRAEHDRTASPRFVLAGWIGFPQMARWLADRLELTAPLEIMNPLQSFTLRTGRFETDAKPAGPEFLQAFGLALRGL